MAGLNLSQAIIKFLPEGKRAEALMGETILRAALRLNVDLASLCGGRGVCGKCKVLVVEGKENLSPMTDSEKRLLSPEEIELGFRLACQAKILGSVTIRIPESSRMGKQKLVILGVEPQITITPYVRKLYLELERPRLDDPKADDLRLLEKLSEIEGCEDIKDEASFSYGAARRLAGSLREGDWKVTVTLRGKEILNVEAGDTRSKLYGYAVDIGTTKIAGFLIDLTDGTLVHAEGIMNPQIPYGEDVMSRITYAMQSLENLEKLKSEVVRGINELLEKACSAARISHEDIYEVVVVGNTAMHHLFFGFNPKYLGLSPYTPVIASSYATKASNLGLKVNPEAYVCSLPIVAGFVGSDAIGCILASRIHEVDEVTMLIDVGTNTEIILGCRDFLYACSTASGPAFEGAHIKFGMRAASGAIESVTISEGGLKVSYRTIDDAEPRGLCGSGIIDAIAEMLREGVIDTSGRIIERGDNPRVRRGSQGLEYVLVWKEETASEIEDIVITQQDIREIQKAKAAIQTGWRILTKMLSLDVRSVKKILMAGAFGSYINPMSAMIIGMLPEVELNNVEYIGNAAGSGARMALKSAHIRREAEIIARKVRYVELAAHPDFEVEYVNAMSLPHAEPSLYPKVTKMIKAPFTSRVYRKTS